VTGVYSIEETSAPEPASMRYDVASDGMGSAEAAPSQVTVAPGQTQITVTVRAVFQIDQPQG
jgi:uncharacterized protein YggE